jgi:thymidylate kinase
MKAADIVDRHAGEPVVIYGTPPPHGRDLDVVASPAAVNRLHAALRADAYEASGKTWVKFVDGGVQIVDITSTSAWGLSSAAEADLLSRCVPLSGCRFVCRPAPAHRLLIEARRYALSSGALSDKSRARIEEAVRENPYAWGEAEKIAAEWGVAQALLCLHRALVGQPQADKDLRRAALEVLRRGGSAHPRASLVRRQIARRRRTGYLVALSGLDGSGKSGQAHRLAAEFDQLGFTSVVVWTRLGSGARLGRAGSLIQKVGTKIVTEPSVPTSSRYADHVEPPNVVRAARERRPWLTWLWALFVVADHLVEQRRSVRHHLRAGRLVVCDRWTLDSLVHVRYRYGATTSLALHEALLRVLSPRADLAFLLAVPGEVAHTRKPDQYSRTQLDKHAHLYDQLARAQEVTTVDGTLTEDAIASTLGVEAWRVVVSNRRSRVSRLRPRGKRSQPD